MAEKTENQGGEPLGKYLQDLRESAGFTLRQVEEASGVSNAYLSQLEHGRISKPSPHVLHKLAKTYGISYELLMEKAGYVTREKGGERRGALPTFAKLKVSPEEEEQLLEYLRFLRTRKAKR